MRTLVPKLSFVIWALWLLRSVAIWLHYDPATSSLTMQDLFDFGLTYSLQGAGLVLSFLLWRQPKRVLAFILAWVSFFALWKFFLGGPALRTLPDFGGLSLSNAMAEWWHVQTRSVGAFYKEVPFAVFLILSVFSWPIYGVFLHTKPQEQAANEPSKL